MNRTQRRLAMKKAMNEVKEYRKEKRYGASEEDIKAIANETYKESLEKMRKEIEEEARIDFMLGALALPMMVLMNHFWTKSYAQKIPKFTELLLEYFHDWENGLITDEKMAKDLWEYGGVRLERNGEIEL